MCGIFFYWSKSSINGYQKKKLIKSFNKIKHRGPDASRVRYHNNNVMVGFHRLAIVDPTDDGMQPFEDERFVLIVNGEIYNYKSLILQEHLTVKSNSDCEVILHLFRKILDQDNIPTTIHLDKLCNKLNGEYAFIIYDTTYDIIMFGVDELRCRPLFIGFNDVNEIYLASEQKAIPVVNKQPILPGHYGIIDYRTVIQKPYYNINGDFFTQKSYFKLENIIQQTTNISFADAALKLRHLIIDNFKLKINPEREFCFLLSGGLDSSIIACIAAAYLYPMRIKTFTAGFDEHASDIIAARKVAKHINSIHTEFIFSFKDGIDAMTDVIYHSESWDQTTNRASTPMLLLLRKIKQKHPEMAVILSGELSDELFMGYLEWKLSPNAQDSHDHSIKRLNDITFFDGLRADRMVAAVGCELRLPFYCRDILEFVLSLPPEYLDPKHNNNIEKKLLREAFNYQHNGKDLIPKEILYRTKAAFSDSTSVVGKTSWKEFLKLYAENIITDSRFNHRKELYTWNTPRTKEDFLYREIFEEFDFNPYTIPYYWMPKWAPADLTDSSATALPIYTE